MNTAMAAMEAADSIERFLEKTGEKDTQGRFERESDGLALRRYRVAVNERPLPPSDRFVRFEKRSDAPFDE